MKILFLSFSVFFASSAFAEDFKCPLTVGVHALEKQKVSVLSQQTMLECYYGGMLQNLQECASVGPGWEAKEGQGAGDLFFCERYEEFSSPKVVDGKSVNSMKQMIDGISN